MSQLPQKYSDFDILNLDWPFSGSHFPAMTTNTAHHTPEISVWDEDKDVVVEAATPGMKPEDIEMTFEKGVLLIRANRKEEKSDKVKKYYQKSSSSYVYRVSIPHDVDEKHEPKATMKDGMLQIRFKKSERALPKKISVQHTK